MLRLELRRLSICGDDGGRGNTRQKNWTCPLRACTYYTHRQSLESSSHSRTSPFSQLLCCKKYLLRNLPFLCHNMTKQLIFPLFSKQHGTPPFSVRLVVVRRATMVDLICRIEQSSLCFVSPGSTQRFQYLHSTS